MEINKAKINDLQAILDLQKICYRENAERYNDPCILPMTQTLEEIEKKFNNNYIFLKAEELSEIVGSIRAFVKNKVCYIGRVIVHPDYQNKGIGTKLMNAIEQEFAGVEKYELFTGYKDDKNLYLYKKLGYKVFKEQTEGKMKFIFLEKKS